MDRLSWWAKTVKYMCTSSTTPFCLRFISACQSQGTTEEIAHQSPSLTPYRMWYEHSLPRSLKPAQRKHAPLHSPLLHRYRLYGRRGTLSCRGTGCTAEVHSCAEVQAARQRYTLVQRYRLYGRHTHGFICAVSVQRQEPSRRDGGGIEGINESCRAAPQKPS